MTWADVNLTRVALWGWVALALLLLFQVSVLQQRITELEATAATAIESGS